MAPILQLDRICRAFPGVQALDDLSVTIEPGTVHALIGENGAGKSTLIKILSGALSPDRGQMRLAGRPYQPRQPHEALRAGVATLYQELNLLPTRSVLANLIVGQEPSRWGVIDRSRARAKAQQALDQLQCPVPDLDTPIAQLTLSEKQQVAIAKALLHDCRVLIMDEPTAALNSAETAALFQVIAVLKARGVTLLYVSHRLAEVFQVADRVTVLRDGREVCTSPIGELTPDELIIAMLGRPISKVFPLRRPAGAEVVLSVDRISSPRAFEDVSFELHAGEVLALTGLAGSGKQEVGQALFGAWPIAQGQVRCLGSASRLTPSQAVALGVGYVPDDRQAEGLLLDENVQRNIALAILPRLSNRWGALKRSGERQAAQRQVEALQIKTPDLTSLVSALSGGNQQKVVLAKWLASGARVLILIEPTQGIDVGVKFEFYDLIAQLAQAGTAILLISAEFSEVAGLAHRVLVMRNGHVTAELQGEQIEAGQVLRAAIGAPGPAREEKE